jgi:predicted phosphoribosyltransferase
MLRAIAHPGVLDVHVHEPPGIVFRNREDAGAKLATRLEAYRGGHVLVLGIPRGGVPVAAAVASALDAELDIVVARKLPSPVSAELGIGAVTADGVRYLNRSILDELGVDLQYLDRVTNVQAADAQRRTSRFRAGSAEPSVTGRTVIVVDDGLATGATMIAAVRSVRARKPARVVVAVPVASQEAYQALQQEADEVVCLSIPEMFWAVGVHYVDFTQTEDEDVDRLLRENREARAQTTASSA